jgi:hypothetical protein
MSENVFYTSPNGDRWLLIRTGNVVMVEHRPNSGSGGRASQVSVRDFLAAANMGPEHQMLRSMQVEQQPEVAVVASGSSRRSVKAAYVARFSYDFHPVDRDKAMQFISRELKGAQDLGLPARILVPFTRGPGCASLHFEIELVNLDQLQVFRRRSVGGDASQASEWIHAFSSILQRPPVIDILTVHDSA